MAEALMQAPVARALIDLSANENPLGPSPKVAAAIQAELAGLHRYPSRDGTKLRNRLAERLALPTDHLLLGNGASELLDTTARVLLAPGDEVLIPVPSFMPYQKVVDRAGATTVRVPMSNRGFAIDALLSAVTPRTRMLLLGNPNNPTGSYIDAAQLERLLTQLPPQVQVVIDEAYVEYVTAADYPDCVALVRNREVRDGAPLLLLRSLSKAWGLAGLRIGYAIGQPELIARLNACCQFYNTNTLAQAAACAALDDPAHLQRTQSLNCRGLQYLTEALAALGLRVWPSQANFLLVDLGDRDGDALIEQLANRGLLVKSMSRFGLPHCLRVSSGLMHDNRALVEALTTLLRRAPSQHCAVENNDNEERLPW